MFNPFEALGWKFKSTAKDENTVKQGYVRPENEDAAFVVGGNYYGQLSYTLNLDQVLTNEYDLVIKLAKLKLGKPKE